MVLVRIQYGLPNLVDVSTQTAEYKSMKDPITLLLNWLGYEYKKPSLLLMHMVDFTHNSWLADLQAQNRMKDYEFSIYTK